MCVDSGKEKLSLLHLCSAPQLGGKGPDLGITRLGFSPGFALASCEASVPY